MAKAKGGGAPRGNKNAAGPHKYSGLKRAVAGGGATTGAATLGLIGAVAAKHPLVLASTKLGMAKGMLIAGLKAPGSVIVGGTYAGVGMGIARNVAIGAAAGAVGYGAYKLGQATYNHFSKPKSRKK